MQKLIVALFLAATLAACSNSEAPGAPPELVTPPEMATEGFLTAYTEATVDMPVADLRAFLEDQPLISFLEPTDSISNPVASQVLAGTWPEPGAARWLRLADGHYVIERVLENRPEFFKYQVFVFTNAVGRGVEQIVGEQRFVAMGNSTLFQWTYNVLPKNIITRQIVRRSMPEIQSYIATGLNRFAAAANGQS